MAGQSRSYDIDGVAWPSVTTILGMLDKGDGLLGWAVNMALAYVRENINTAPPIQISDLEEVLTDAKDNWRKSRDEAADIGKEVHALISEYIRHGKDAIGTYRPAVENGFLAFLEWERQNEVEWLESEKEVFDPLHGYAGTLDAKCRFKGGEYKGRVFIIDFKSSKGFYDGYAEQIAAYRHADSLTTHIPVDGMGILRLDKETGAPTFRDFSEVFEDRRDFFFALCHCYFLQKTRRLKANPYVARGIGKLVPWETADKSAA